jgi:hypothetical protein
MRIGVAIPCTKQSLSSLKACLDSIEQQTVKPDAVVISCSSTHSKDLPTFSYSFPLKVITTLEKKNTAENRNIASMLLDTDIVSFFESTDTMHPQRLQYIQESFMKYQPDIVLHNYSEKVGLNQMIQLHKAPAQVENQLCRSPSGCAMIQGNLPIHHSHVSVSRFIMLRYKFREDISNEGRDNAIFCGDVLDMQGVKSVYLGNSLSYT